MSRALLRLAFCLTLAALIGGTSANAQNVRFSFGSSLQLDGSALEITADNFEVDQTSGASTFSGNVLAVQGRMRISAQSLRLEYAPGARAGTQRIGSLTASGGVAMVTDTEAIEAQRAVYSIADQRLEMTGDVVLVQGINLLSGERFIADLRAGTGSMTGRVRTIIRME
ncbi:LptA/OstA family protein [Pararhodobacter sp.]|uniref:LptA/OstA family protein n=1 Tax=Pararhodobacter sp. TaxID=2127056 RepID=UPI002AFF2F91|nr:LptA/OstA family protein [Pararhodobacter sp.]